jgi:hypothetical protein
MSLILSITDLDQLEKIQFLLEGDLRLDYIFEDDGTAPHFSLRPAKLVLKQ